jgi:aquaporin NIP
MPMMQHRRSKFFAEAIGTFGIVFFGCGSLMLRERLPDSLNPMMIAPIFGIAVATMIYSLGHISGAHFNPAVTLAFAVTRHFNWKELPAYWTAQLAGSLLATFVLYLLFPHGHSYGATLPVISVSSAFAWEFMLTFFLMFVISAVATDSRAVGIMAGASIGAVVTLGAYVGGPMSGASMNPARSFGPAIFQNELSTLWIYLLAPLAGAVAGAWLYEKMRCNHVPATKEILSGEKKKTGGCC